MRYMIVIFVVATTLIWDGWFNSGRWADQAARAFMNMLTWVGLN